MIKIVIVPVILHPSATPWKQYGCVTPALLKAALPNVRYTSFCSGSAFLFIAL